MAVGLFIVAAGVLALMFYVMYLVKPKRVRLNAKVLKVVELNIEADSGSGEPEKLYGENAPMGDGSRKLRRKRP